MGLPGPRLTELARRAASVRRDPIAYLEDVQRRYGELVALPVPGPPVLLVTDPEAVGHILRTHAARWTKQTIQYGALAAVTGPGLLADHGPGWMSRRRTLAPAFHHARLAGLGEVVRDCARPTLEQWRALPAGGAVVDVGPLADTVALEVLGRGLFSQDLSPVAADLLAATEEVARLVVARAQSLPLPSWLPTRVGRELARAVAQLDRICHQVIADRRRRGSVSSGVQGADLLGLLLAADLPDAVVRDELVTMVIAGHETVAAALTWTLHLLAEHPHAQARLRDEARRPDRPVTGWRREDLPWTSAVVDESLRIRPPAWVLTRRAAQPDVLAGQPVPEGTLAVISPWLVHRRVRSWPDPERFDPERFLGGGTAARADYIPFGLGPRLCIGRDFALLELRVLLAELLRDHAVSPPDRSGAVEREVEREVTVTVRPRGGLPLHVAPAP